MKLIPTALTLAIITLAAGGPITARAAEPGWYGGVNLGRGMASIDDPRITRELLGNGFTATQIQNRDRHEAYKLFGGYQLSNYFAVEGGYFDLGEYGFHAVTTPVGTLDGNMRVQGFNVDLVGSVPISNRLSAIGRVGWNFARTRDHFEGTGAVTVANPDPSKRENNYKYGLGLGYELTPSWALRLEGERYRVNDAVGNKGHVDVYSLGLVYHFGVTPKAAPPQRLAYTEAAPIAPPPPPPAPVVVAPPPPPPPPPPAPVPVVVPLTKVSFAADSLFDFDQSTVKASGREALDRFAVDLKGLRYDRIRITGHSDRIGSSAYNLALSKRRAEAVSLYLIQTAGVSADRIDINGVGESQPVTHSEDCKGQRANPALIACLQPDRRVDVEVSGLK